MWGGGWVAERDGGEVHNNLRTNGLCSEDPTLLTKGHPPKKERKRKRDPFRFVVRRSAGISLISLHMSVPTVQCDSQVIVPCPADWRKWRRHVALWRRVMMMTHGVAAITGDGSKRQGRWGKCGSLYAPTVVLAVARLMHAMPHHGFNLVVPRLTLRRAAHAPMGITHSRHGR